MSPDEPHARARSRSPQPEPARGGRPRPRAHPGPGDGAVHARPQVRRTPQDRALARHRAGLRRPPRRPRPADPRRGADPRRRRPGVAGRPQGRLDVRALGRAGRRRDRGPQPRRVVRRRQARGAHRLDRVGDPAEAPRARPSYAGSTRISGTARWPSSRCSARTGRRGSTAPGRSVTAGVPATPTGERRTPRRPADCRSEGRADVWGPVCTPPGRSETGLRAV